MFILPEVLDELVTLRTKAKDAATSFTEAIKAQAKDHEVGKGALRRFVCAVETADSEKMAELEAEIEEIQRMIREREERE